MASIEHQKFNENQKKIFPNFQPVSYLWFIDLWASRGFNTSFGRNHHCIFAVMVSSNLCFKLQNATKISGQVRTNLRFFQQCHSRQRFFVACFCRVVVDKNLRFAPGKTFNWGSISRFSSHLIRNL